MKRRRKIPYLVVYYLVFVMCFSIIKHFAGWNAHTFEQLGATESNFVGSTIAFLSEIALSLIVGVILFLIVTTRPIGKLIILATATVIPVTLVFLLVAHFTLGYVNNKVAAESNQQLHSEIISRLPDHVFTKKSGAKNDFTGYVSDYNDSLGLIVADSNKLARVYIYVDSVKLGAFDFDSCTTCNPALQKILTSIVLPLQSLSTEEMEHNISLVNNGQCYVADRNIYLGYCRKPGRKFIIINNVYDIVRHVTCYEIGFQVDAKTPEPHRFDLFE